MSLYSVAEVHPHAAGAMTVKLLENLMYTSAHTSDLSILIERDSVASVHRPDVPDPPSDVRSFWSYRTAWLDVPYPVVGYRTDCHPRPSGPPPGGRSSDPAEIPRGSVIMLRVDT